MSYPLGESGGGRIIEVGATASVIRKIGSEDLEQVAQLSLDRNPIHFDEKFARTSFFGEPIAHGMLGVLLLSGALTKLMGAGNVWLSSDFAFQGPIIVGGTLTAKLSVVSVERRRIAEIDAQVTNQKDEVLIKSGLRSMLAAHPLKEKS